MKNTYRSRGTQKDNATVRQDEDKGKIGTFEKKTVEALRSMCRIG